jgi:uncharacterized membrane-anchored protein
LRFAATGALVVGGIMVVAGLQLDLGWKLAGPLLAVAVVAVGGSIYLVVARAQARADQSVEGSQATEASESQATQPSPTPAGVGDAAALQLSLGPCID